MKITAIIQARCGSSRFPDKILKKLDKRNSVELIIDKLKKIKLINNIVIATTNKKKDKILKKIAKDNEIHSFLGSEKNVYSRFVKINKIFNPDYIIRVTSDCPLIENDLIKKGLSKLQNFKYDYVSNINPPTFPDGLDFEIFKASIIDKIPDDLLTEYDKEHVTPIIKKVSKTSHNIVNKKNLSKLRLTLDNKSDLNELKKVLNLFKKKKLNFNQRLKYYSNYKNQKNLYERNYGSYNNLGQERWNKAEKIIPGGNSLLSKRPNQFIDNIWPCYFTKSKGIEIWDLDKKKYLDFSNMSVGTNILGYANTKINKTVINAIKLGNMSTLNSYEELELAEKLIKIHPDFDMVKFARTGGEANSIAIRIARAKNKNKNIAICGYHGWHDWYLSTNLINKKNLDQHLIKGLNIEGVPPQLKNTVHAFNYNDFKSLKKICKTKNIGIIKMEVMRNIKPKNNFLKKIRKFCDEKKIILIFDECTSGFRETFGGLYKKFDVKPDICILGKAIGNGFPITAVLGSKEIMQYAKKTFISSTFWSERTGYTAALATLNEMQRIQSWKLISRKGEFIKKKWKKIANKYKIKIKISGLSSLPSFEINSKNWGIYKTLITKIMLENQILASNTVYISIYHTDSKIRKYLKILDKIFKKICIIEKNKSVSNLFWNTNEKFGRLN